MSAHLLPVTLAWMARLPDHTPILVRHSAHTSACCVLVTDAEGRVVLPIGGSDPDLDRLPGSCMLDLSDALTAAAVAARVVRPWQTARYNNRSLPDDARLLTNAELSVLERAEMLDLGADDLDTLARLARAAMEVA